MGGASLAPLPLRGAFAPFGRCAGFALAPSAITRGGRSLSGSDRKSKRGPARLPVDQRRDHCVSVRVNDDELERIDILRRLTGSQRGEFLRIAALHPNRLPPQVPALNREAWTELSRAASNLNQLAMKSNFGDHVPLAQVRDELAAFRSALLGARLGDEGDHLDELDAV